MSYLNKCIWTASGTSSSALVAATAALGGYLPSGCKNPLVIDGGLYRASAFDGAGNHQEGYGTWDVATSTLTFTTITNSSNSGSAVTFTSAPTVLMGGPEAADVLSQAQSSTTWYVNQSSGNDTNNGSSGSPFKTVQHAVNVAATYNWTDFVGGNFYQPTIQLQNGAFTNTQVNFPVLANCPAGGIIVGNSGSPTSVTVADGGTNYAFTMQKYANWAAYGVSFNGTFGGIFIDSFAVLTNPGGAELNFAGSFSNSGIEVQGLGAFYGPSSAITVTATTMNNLFASFGVFDLDGCGVTFSNAITFSAPWMQIDSPTGFIAWDSGSITNGGNVTCSSGIALTLSNGAYFEGDGLLVDGTQIARTNFPGVPNGAVISFGSNCTFGPDGGTVVSAGQFFGFVDTTSLAIPTKIQFYSSGIIIQQAGSQPQNYAVMNNYTNGGNFEAAFFDWTLDTNVLTIGTFALGSGSARAFKFVYGGTAVGDFGKTTANTWTFGAPVNITGNLGVNGSILSTSTSGGVGYATGAGVGGTVTQATSKSTGVTLSKLTGRITMNAAALAASTTVSFTLTNTTIAAGDVLVLNHVSGGTAGSYTLNAQAAAGSASINVRNVSLASLSEAIVIGFVVIKGSTN